MERIRFTLVEDDEDRRPFDFDTRVIQIGCDPNRGDNLLLDLPAKLRHIRARVTQGSGYIEFEVIAGPIWLQGSRMETGDVAELNVGDMLIFGTRKPRGARLRFGYATEAEIVMDDVADWTVSSTARPKKRKSVEDDMMFEEEVDEYAGLNPWQKAQKWYRKKYASFANFRKKAARIKYWTTLAQTLIRKAGKIAATVMGVLAIGGTLFVQNKAKVEAEESETVAREAEVIAVENSRTQQRLVVELQEKMTLCGCEGTAIVDVGAIAAGEAIMQRFGDENPTLDVEVDTILPKEPDGSPRRPASYSSLISKYKRAAEKDRTLIPRTMNRLCSATHDKARMNLVVEEVNRFGLHEAYSFIPFVESYWCELAVSFTGPRGMMQFTRNTASEAFKMVPGSQSEIPNYSWTDHRAWMKAHAKKQGYSYGRMLASCSESDRIAYKQHFYKGRANPKYPKRLDPNDPRTDWADSTKAAFAWMDHLNTRYRSKGWRQIDAMMLAVTAYNQGEGEVQRWIKTAMKRHRIDNPGNLTFPQIYAGGLVLADQEKNTEKRRQIYEGLRYASKVVGTYLAVAPLLDERQCR